MAQAEEQMRRRASVECNALGRHLPVDDEHSHPRSKTSAPGSADLGPCDWLPPARERHPQRALADLSPCAKCVKQRRLPHRSRSLYLNHLFANWASLLRIWSLALLLLHHLHIITMGDVSSTRLYLGNLPRNGTLLPV